MCVLCNHPDLQPGELGKTQSPMHFKTLNAERCAKVQIDRSVACWHFLLQFFVLITMLPCQKHYRHTLCHTLCTDHALASYFVSHFVHSTVSPCRRHERHIMQHATQLQVRTSIISTDRVEHGRDPNSNAERPKPERILTSTPLWGVAPEVATSTH